MIWQQILNTTYYMVLIFQFARKILMFNWSRSFPEVKYLKLTSTTNGWILCQFVVGFLLVTSLHWTLMLSFNQLNWYRKLQWLFIIKYCKIELNEHMATATSMHSCLLILPPNILRTSHTLCSAVMRVNGAQKIQTLPCHSIIVLVPQIMHRGVYAGKIYVRNNLVACSHPEFSNQKSA